MIGEYEQKRIDNINERKRLWDELMEAKDDFDNSDEKEKKVRKMRASRHLNDGSLPLRRSERSKVMKGNSRLLNSAIIDKSLPDILLMSGHYKSSTNALQIIKQAL